MKLCLNDNYLMDLLFVEYMLLFFSVTYKYTYIVNVINRYLLVMSKIVLIFIYRGFFRMMHK